jgi:hypothetical protein
LEVFKKHDHDDSSREKERERERETEESFPVIVAHVMDAMHALPSRQHVVVKYQSGCVVVVALIVAACGHASPRQLPARTWRRNEEKNKRTYKQALPFLSKEQQTDY